MKDSPKIQTDNVASPARDVAVAPETAAPEDMPALTEQLEPKGSGSETTRSRFDVMCMVTKGSARKIINSLELYQYIKDLNVDLDDLHFLYFPQIYRLEAKSEHGPYAFDVYKFSEDGMLMKQQHIYEAEIGHGDEEPQYRSIQVDKEKYDTPQPAATFGTHSLDVRRFSTSETALDLRGEKQEVQAAIRTFIEALEDRLQQKQTLPSSIANLVHAMIAYDTYVVDMEIDVDRPMLEIANAIISQCKANETKQKGCEVTEMAGSADEGIQEIEPVEKLQDLVLRAFNAYTKNRLARNAEIDPEVLIAAKEIVLTNTARSNLAWEMFVQSNDTAQDEDAPDLALGKAEQGINEKAREG